MEISRVLSVTEINASIRGLLETQFPFVNVAGEISNLRRPFSGHLYFTLKDDRSQIKAVLFKMQQRYLSNLPVDGQKVVCRGRISVYEPRGDYQIIVDAVDFHGTGSLQLQFDMLKKKLAGEGLFKEENKKPLPVMPEHITLITSPNGAAVHDFLKVARNRCPQVKIAVYPVAVQGPHAAGEITEAINTINASLPTDMIILCRGGGSLEDLWAFNEEEVARAIATSGIPVVSAVGHEIDFSIADFTADLRAPTPSAAAEMILPDTRQLKAEIRQLGARMVRTMSVYLDRAGNQVDRQSISMTTWSRNLELLLIRVDQTAQELERAMHMHLTRKQDRLKHSAQQLNLNSPVARLMLNQRKVDELHRRVLLAGKRTVEDSAESLYRTAGLLDAVSPLSTLARGYSIARKHTEKRTVVTDYRTVDQNDIIEVTLHRGYLLCKIEKTGQRPVSEKLVRRYLELK